MNSKILTLLEFNKITDLLAQQAGSALTRERIAKLAPMTNMRMVREDATDEQIIECLKLACAWEFVSKLPDGINSKVRERGKGVSEGQAQRLSIARAMLRDSPILLLDEVTSALDEQTEERVLDNIIRYCPNKTCIVATHRPSVLKHCKRIYRITNKSIEPVERSVAEAELIARPSEE